MGNIVPLSKPFHGLGPRGQLRQDKVDPNYEIESMSFKKWLHLNKIHVLLTAMSLYRKKKAKLV